MKRFAILVLLAAAGSVLGVTTAARAGGMHTGTGTGTTSTTGTTTTTTTTTPDPVNVVKSFPAAGQMTVNTVIVRRGAAPHAKKILIWHYFRIDYRPQEVLAIGVRT